MRIGWRRSSKSAAARSASVSTPIRRSSRGAGRTFPTASVAEHAAEAVAAALPLADRARGAGLRCGQAAARLLRAPRGARLGGARRGLRGGSRSRAAGGRRRQARRRAGHGSRLRAGARRRDADAVGPGCRARRRRLHRQSAARRRRPRAAGRGGARRPALESSPWSGPATPGPPTSRTSPAPSSRCTSGSRRWSTGSRSGLLGEGGLSGMGAVVGATEPEHIARLRSLMPRSIFLIPGVGAQGGRPEMLGAAFRPGPAAALVAASRGHRRRRRTRRRRRRACERRFGTFRPHETPLTVYTIFSAYPIARHVQ